MAKYMTQGEIADKVKTLCNGLTSENLITILTELYYGLRAEEKDKFLRETENA